MTQDFVIRNVYALKRDREFQEFEARSGWLEPKCSLVHASRSCNFVGLLSRGLLMPKVKKKSKLELTHSHTHLHARNHVYILDRTFLCSYAKHTRARANIHDRTCTLCILARTNAHIQTHLHMQKPAFFVNSYDILFSKQVVVQQELSTRTDFGFLGAGVYFRYFKNHHGYFVHVQGRM